MTVQQVLLAYGAPTVDAAYWDDSINNTTYQNSYILSNSNFTWEAAGNTSSIIANVGHTSGKWYFEVYMDRIHAGTNSPAFGASQYGVNRAGNAGNYSVRVIGGVKYKYMSADFVTITVGSPVSFVDGDVGQCALDLDAGKIYFGRNNTWYESANPATATNPMSSSVPSTSGFIYVHDMGNASGSTGAIVTLRSRTSEFSYAAPAGFTQWAG